MKRKLGLLMLLVVMCWLLAGCQLAKEDQGERIDQDHLIGLYITTEYLDLFDSEYQNRLYAVLQPKTYDGTETREVVFESLPGIAFFLPTIPDADGQEGYITIMQDECVLDVRNNIHLVDDNQQSTALEGTIYVTPSKQERYFYFNPVYQSADGSVYVTSGTCFIVGNEWFSEGALYSQTIDSSASITENGVSKTVSMSVKLSINVMLAPEKIVICQLDENYHLIAQNEYLPAEMPDAITPERGTACLIVETHSSGGSIARSIYGVETEGIETYFVREDGICLVHRTEIH